MVNCIEHLLGQFDYHDVEQPEIVRPERERHDDHVRQPLPQSMVVPELY